MSDTSRNTAVLIMDYQSLIRSPNAAALFFLILQETDNGKKDFTMSYAEIGKVINVTRQQARWLLQILEKNGFINGTHKEHTLSTHLTNYKLASCGVLKNTSHTLSTHFHGEPFVGEDITPQQKAYNGWLKFYKERCTHIYNRFDQLTFAQFCNLKERYGSKILSVAVLNLDNRIDLHKRYVSLYLTLHNWCKNEENRKE